MATISRKISFVLATILAFAITSVPASADQNIVVVDVNAALTNSKAGKSMASQIESQMKVLSDDAQKFEARMASAEASIHSLLLRVIQLTQQLEQLGVRASVGITTPPSRLQLPPAARER